MRSWMIALAAIILAGGSFLASSRADDPKPRNLIMQKKLGDAQRILEGLAVKDFDAIEKHADELILLSKKVEWLVLKTPEYERQSNDFRNTASQIVEAAKKKNLDAAALGYVQLTMNCVNCHKYVRDQRMTSND
jgi:cytochrome c556